MQNIESNHTLVENIAASTTSQLFIAQSHLPTSNLQQTKTLLGSIRDPLTTPVGSVGLVILALAITLLPLWYKRVRKED